MVSRTRLILLAALSVVAVAAATSASASALEWYRCFKVAVAGTGKYEDSHCQTPGGTKEFEKELIKTLLNIVTKQTEPYILEYKLGGVTVEIKCEEERGTGSIHNGLAPKDLEPEKGSKILVGLGLINIAFSTCTVPKPAGQGVK